MVLVGVDSIAVTCHPAGMPKRTKIDVQNDAICLCTNLRDAGNLNPDGCSFSGSLEEFKGHVRTAKLDKKYSHQVVRIAYDLAAILDC